MVDFDDIKRDLSKARDPRQDGNQEPAPRRPRLADIVTGQVQAPRPNVPPPVPVHPARRGSTMTGLPAPPAAESAPQPPKLTLRDLGPLEPVSVPPGRKVSPVPWELDAVVEQVEAAASARGDEVVRAPGSATSTPLPTPSLRARAEQSPLLRQLAIIAGAATGIAGVITALGSAITSIITATRPASNLELERKIEALQQRVDANQGVTLEAETRRKKDEELAAADEALKKSVEELKPKATIQGIAPPK